MKSPDLCKALISFLVLNTLWVICECNLLVPHRYTSTSELRYRSSDNEKALDSYLVDEYVDLAAGKSSLRLQNRQDNSVKIYYNEVPEPEKQTFIAYDTAEMSCKSTQIFDWALAKIRSTVIKLIPSDLLSSELCDVALGPSGLLLAIEETLDEFRYIKTKFSRSKLLPIDVFERRMIREVQRTTLWVLVSIPSASDTTVKERTLAEVAQSRRDAFIMTIMVVEIESELLDQISDNDDLIPEGKILLIVNYFRMMELRSDSLLGEDLDQSSEMDFHKNPFLKPVGVGCMSRDVSLDEEKVFVAAAPQFSASYQTKNGFRSLSYVAYDGRRQMLRLDRDGRKSIFDLILSRSYHENLYNSFNEKTDKANERKNCIAIETSDPTIRKSFMLERLIGIGLSSSNAAVYLGPKLIEHTMHEVYELELQWTSDIQGYNLPILLEAAGFIMPKSSSDKSRRFFLTYYTQEHASRPDICVLRDNDPANQQNGDTVLLPKYIELWALKEHKEGVKERILVNRLEFSEFNWSLDVEPSGDPTSQRDLSSIFNMDSCAHDRSSQSLIRFRIRHDKSKSQQETDRKLLSVFQSNQHALREAIHERLANILALPLINLVHLEVSLIRNDSLDLQIASRAIEMSEGQPSNKFLGYMKFKDLETTHKLSIASRHFNRHSLDSCRLDSISAGVKNVPIYCPGLTFCVILKEEALDKLGVLEQTDKNSLSRSSSPDLAICEVHRFRWSEGPIKGQPVLNRIRDNKFKLASSHFKLDFNYRDPSNQLTERIAYGGYADAVEMKSVDPFGAKPPVSGLRFSSRAEEPDSFNMNKVFTLSQTNADDRYQSCQRACQLNDHCQSFSFCRRRKGVNTLPTDCVLSTLRLTADRIKAIEEVVTLDYRAGNLDIQASGAHHSEVFKFKRDFDCNLHPKDTAATFAIERAYYVVGAPTVEAGKLQEETISSFEECADTCYETSVWLEGNATFTYCPLSSVCLQDGDMSLRSLDIAQTCYVYSLAHTKFYNRRFMTRLAIRLNDSDQPSEKEQLESYKIGRWLVGLDEQQCARDCNLQSSNCFAFDFCRLEHSERSICVLYSIRSPFSSKRRRLGLLPEERQFYGSDEERKERSTAKITGSQDCSHYDLKEIYLDIRLQMVLDSLLLNKDGSEQSTEEVALERAVISQDQSSSDDLIAHYVKTNENAAAVAEELDSTCAQIHSSLLFVGLLVGSLVSLYAGQAFILALDCWATFKARREARRNTGYSVSHIELTNDLCNQ